MELLQQPEAGRRLEIAEAQQTQPHTEREVYRIEHMGHPLKVQNKERIGM